MSALADQIAREHQRNDQAAGGHNEPREFWTTCTCGAHVWDWQQHYAETEETSDEAWTDHVAEVTEQAVREQVAIQAAIRSAALFEAAWDEGNAMGLDGWTGPERGSEPDQHAIDRRERTVDRLTDELRARITREGSDR